MTFNENELSQIVNVYFKKNLVSILNGDENFGLNDARFGEMLASENLIRLLQDEFHLYNPGRDILNVIQLDNIIHGIKLKVAFYLELLHAAGFNVTIICVIII